jgi:hypothetical protein
MQNAVKINFHSLFAIEKINFFDCQYAKIFTLTNNITNPQNIDNTAPTNHIPTLNKNIIKFIN